MTICLIVEPVFILFISNENTCIWIGEKSVSSCFLRYCGFEFLERMGVNFEMQLSYDAYLLVIQTRTEIDFLIVA